MTKLMTAKEIAKKVINSWHGNILSEIAITHYIQTAFDHKFNKGIEAAAKYLDDAPEPDNPWPYWGDDVRKLKRPAEEK